MQKFKGLYALCDYQTLQKKNLSLRDFLILLSKYETFYIQYRDKINSLDIQKKNIDFLKQNCNIPIIINDHFELLEYADGLHLGQEDCENLQNRYNFDSFKQTIDFLRSKYPNKIFGLSTHNIQEIKLANDLDLDYVGLGAYANTSTKDIKQILGSKISEIAKYSKHPVGAIGGVKIDDRIDNITYNVVGSALYDN
jgi:thiamine-phosphate pyrophosphorylase